MIAERDLYRKFLFVNNLPERGLEPLRIAPPDPESSGAPFVFLPHLNKSFE